MSDTPSTPGFDTSKKLAKVFSFYKIGAICPQEMWSGFEALLLHNAGEILDTLPPEVQAELRKLYREQPLWLWDDPLGQKVEWWLANGRPRR